MLAAREARQHRQQELAARWPEYCLVGFCLNIAGPIKRFPLGDSAFAVGSQSIREELERQNYSAAESIKTDEDTGLELVWAVEAEPLALKGCLARIEECHPLGRLFDIDVIRPGGRLISRCELGLPERGCLICGKPGPGCARSREHSLEELNRKTAILIWDYLTRQYADRAAGCAVRALLWEVCITPKPGLVDRANNGAHRDMSLFTFLDSSCALIPYFREVTLLAIRHRERPPEELLPLLRYPGRLAEEAMLQATAEINTHKGIVFSMGLVCAAIGLLYSCPEAERPEAILSLAGKIAAPAVRKDFSFLDKEKKTHGEALFAAHGITGARGEAAAGFPSVRTIGLPVLRRELAADSSLNDAGVVVLLHLMAHLEDTNIISRGGIEVQSALQQELADLLKSGSSREELLNAAALLDERLIRQNISPGGCADLLALTLMLSFWEEIHLNLPQEPFGENT